MDALQLLAQKRDLRLWIANLVSLVEDDKGPVSGEEQFVEHGASRRAI